MDGGVVGLVRAGSDALDADTLLRDGLAREVMTLRGPMAVFRNDRGALTQSLQAYGEWAELELAFCGRFVGPGDTIVDAGAYIGTHSAAFAEMTGPDGRVFSFEAQPASFALLSRNLAGRLACTRGGAVNAVLGAAGVADAISLERIDIAASHSFGSAIVESAQDPSPSASATASVPTTTLDALGLDRCALVKIDVEGMEDQVLAGAEQLLARCAPLVYAECNGIEAGHRTAIRLRAAGYGVWMHVVDAYNPHNLYGNPANIFGTSREAALVGVPSHLVGLCSALRAGEHEYFFEVHDLDDMVAGMLLKPQYPREVLQHTSAFRSRGGA